MSTFMVGWVLGSIVGFAVGIILQILARASERTTVDRRTTAWRDATVE